MRIRNKIRWFMLLGLINCGTAAYSQDVLLVANPGVHISRISDEDARAISCERRLDSRTAPMRCR